MNIVLKLKADVARLDDTLKEVADQVVAIKSYLSSPKFAGVDNDWVCVSTDIAPKLVELRFTLLEILSRTTPTVKQDGKPLDARSCGGAPITPSLNDSHANRKYN